MVGLGRGGHSQYFYTILQTIWFTVICSDLVAVDVISDEQKWCFSMQIGAHPVSRTFGVSFTFIEWMHYMRSFRSNAICRYIRRSIWCIQVQRGTEISSEPFQSRFKSILIQTNHCHEHLNDHCPFNISNFPNHPNEHVLLFSTSLPDTQFYCGSIQNDAPGL